MQEKGSHCEINPKSTWLSSNMKNLSFCEIWNNPTPPLLFIRSLYNKHCRTWSSSIKILLPEWKRSNNYLELSTENVMGNMMLSQWPCFTWKFVMIWFHKILELIFQKQPSYPRKWCTEHWKKLPNLIAFLEIVLYLKNNNSGDMCKKFC